VCATPGGLYELVDPAHTFDRDRRGCGASAGGGRRLQPVVARGRRERRSTVRSRRNIDIGPACDLRVTTGIRHRLSLRRISYRRPVAALGFGPRASLDGLTEWTLWADRVLVS